jgi:hypothetical protein
MLKLTTNLSDIKKSQLIYLVQAQTDLKKIDFLELDVSIKNDALACFKKKKNTKRQYFI